MKKRTTLLIALLFIVLLVGVTVSFVLILNKPDKSTELHTEDYTLFFQSNGDGTCYVSDIKISSEAENVELVVPRKNAVGELVTAYNTKALTFQNLPLILSKEGFLNHIDAPMRKAVEEGALTEFLYRKIVESVYSEKSLENQKTERERERLLAAYPLAAVTDLYVLEKDIRLEDKEILSSYLAKYASYTNEHAVADAKRLIELALQNEIENHGITLPNRTYCVTGLQLPDTMTSICNNAFAGMENLSAVTLPKSLTEIGDRAFSCCCSLQQIVIPGGVTKLGIYSFSYCSELTQVIISNGVKSFGEGMFQGCTALTNVLIPNSVTEIGNAAFSECTGLVSVSIPNSVTLLGEGAFSQCESLQGVIIPGSITSIGSGAFYQCKNLESVVILDGTKSIGWGAFSECENLKHTILPDSIAEIAGEAFYNCKKLTGIQLPSNLIALGEDAFGNCKQVIQRDEEGFSFVGDWIIMGPWRENLVLPQNAVGIAAGAFDQQTAMQSIVFNKNLKYIGNCAFYRCINLTDVTLPSKLVSIGTEAFAFCEALEKIEIPGGVNSIGARAFSNCKSLTSIILPNPLRKIEDGMFEFCVKLEHVGFPTLLSEIGSFAFTNCISLVDVKIPSTVTTIGNGAFSDCAAIQVENQASYVDQWLVSFDGSERELVLRETTVGIADFAISNDNCQLVNITLPEGLKHIGDSAFYTCRGLESIIIPSSILRIGENIFRYPTTVYYNGTAEEWKKVVLVDSLESESLSIESLYYYTETQPAIDGNYWRYMDGVPTPWEQIAE